MTVLKQYVPDSGSWESIVAGSMGPTGTYWYVGNGAYLAPGYLTPTVGTVTSPDRAAFTLDRDMVLVVRARQDHWLTGDQSIVGPWESATNRSWVLYLQNGVLAFSWSTDGSAIARTASFAGLSTYFPDGIDFMLAIRIQATTGRVAAMRSTDGGATWVEIGNASTGTAFTSFDSSSALRIGSRGGGTSTLWAGRIYSVQMFDGVDPSGNSSTGASITYPGVAGNYLSVADSAALDITGDIEIVARVGLNDWTPPLNSSTIIAKDGTPGSSAPAGSRSWYLRAYGGATAILQFCMSADGTTAPTAVSSTAITPMPADGQMIWLKVTRVQATGLCSFYWQADSPTEPVGGWTAIGTATLMAGTPLYAGTANVSLGQHQTFDVAAGRMPRVILRNGIGGTVVLDVDEALIPASTGPITSFPARSGQTVNVSSTAGNSPLVPKPQTTLWKFEAGEYPGTGTTWTDPRGVSWTVTNASAITKLLRTPLSGDGYIDAITGNMYVYNGTSWALVGCLAPRATNTETIDGISTTLLVTPAGLKAALQDYAPALRAYDDPVVVDELPPLCVNQPGTIASGTAIPLVVATHPMTVRQLALVNTTGVAGTASDTDYWTLTLRRTRAGVVATIATKDTRIAGGGSILPMTNWDFDTATFANNVLTKGDIVDLRIVATGAPTNTLANLLASMRIEPA